MFYEKPALDVVANNDSFTLQVARDGLVLFERSPSGLVTQVDVRQEQGTTLSPLVRFDDKIGLLDYEVEPLENRHYLLHYEWVALQDLTEMPLFFAISHLQPDFQSRFFHLPTWAQYPSSDWQVGEVVIEEMEIVIPDEVPAGTYSFFVSWYDASAPTVAETDQESRVGEEYLLTEIQVY
jgi:hypothetical protein